METDVILLTAKKSSGSCLPEGTLTDLAEEIMQRLEEGMDKVMEHLQAVEQ